jgi:hypothetical protein
MIMRNDLTDITVVLDRSGSMQACRSDAEGGLNHFIEEQMKAPGEAFFTLVQFDNEYEFVHKGIPIQTVPHCTLHPRGRTALLDAIGRAINETGSRLETMLEAERPGLVVFAILTDGMENASREFTQPKIKEMIEHQQNVYKWQFTYLGANQDAFQVAASYGISLDAAANYTPDKAVVAFANAASNVKRMRKARSSGETVHSGYTEEERKAMSSQS